MASTPHVFGARWNWRIEDRERLNLLFGRKLMIPLVARLLQPEQSVVTGLD